MVRMKNPLSTAEDKLEFSIRCYELGYHSASNDDAAGRIWDGTGDYEPYLKSVASDSFPVIPHLAELTEETRDWAIDAFQEAFSDGYTEYICEKRGEHIKLREGFSVRVFLDPISSTWAYNYIETSEVGTISSIHDVGFSTKGDAIQHAQQHQYDERMWQ